MSIFSRPWVERLRATGWLWALLYVHGCAGDPGRDAAAGEVEAVSYGLFSELGAGDDPGTYFTGIAAGFFVDEGRLVIADQRELRLTRFDLRTGAYEHIGRAGDGPGEFRNISAAGVVGGGSMWVADRLRGRITILAGDSASSATAVTVRDYFFAPPLAPEGPAARLADGNLLMMPTRAEARPGFPDTLVHQPLIRVNSSGSVVDTILLPPPAALEGLLVAKPDGGFIATRKLMREPPVVSVDPTGLRVGFLHRTAGVDSAIIGTLYVAEIGGSSVRIDTIPIPGRSIPGSRDELVRRVNTLDIEGWPGGEEAFAEELAERLPVPRWISPIATYRLDSEGTHWIGIEDRYRGDRKWLRRAEGARVWQPVEFERPVTVILDARNSLVAGVIIDSLGVQTVGVFERR